MKYSIIRCGKDLRQKKRAHAVRSMMRNQLDHRNVGAPCSCCGAACAVTPELERAFASFAADSMKRGGWR